MNTSLFQEYADLEFEFKLLEDKKSELRNKILDELKKNGIEKTETSVGVFTVASKKVYKYSEAVTKLADRLKIAKHKEEEKGIATPSISEYLLFTRPKEE